MDATPEAIIATAGGVELHRYPWPLLSPKQCAAAPHGSYIIKGLIAPGNVGVLFGQPGTGKSVLAPDIGYRVARGEPVFGRRTKECPVLYVACEDGTGMQRRVEAMLKVHGDAPGFRLLAEPVDLRDPKMVLLVREAAADFGAGLIMVDTIAAAFPGIRENEDGPEGMGCVVTTLRALTRSPAGKDNERPPAVLAVHHATKADGTTARGHGSLTGDVDITMRLQGEPADIKTVTLGKNRNGASTDTFAFSIRVIDLRKDEDGDPITAPVAVEQDPEQANVKAGGKRKKEAQLPDAAANVLTVLRNLEAEGAGEHVHPEHGFPKVLAIKRRVLIDRLVRDGWFIEEELRVTVPDAGNALLPIERRAQTRLGKALDALKRKGLAHYSREWAWVL